MLKTLGFLPRRNDFTRPGFRDYYERCHTPLALQHIRVFAKYVRNHVVDAQVGDLPFDTVSEFWYDDADAISAVASLLDSPAGVVLREDEAKFMDRSMIGAFGVREQHLYGPVRDVEPGPLRKFALLLTSRGNDTDRRRPRALQDYCTKVVEQDAPLLHRAVLDTPTTATPAHLPVAALLWLWPASPEIRLAPAPPDQSVASMSTLVLDSIETPRDQLRD